jgi:hypothetical protein
LKEIAPGSSAKAKNAMTEPLQENALCAECLENVQGGSATIDGRALCIECADLYYVACEACKGLVPREEAADREEKLYCLGCFAKPEAGSAAVRIGDEELEALLAEFLRLHAEEKKIKDRLEEIKERLKGHASTEPRVVNAVVLRAGESAVKCGYSTRISYEAEKLSLLESMFGAEAFGALFEREVKFSPIKEALDAFLASQEPGEAEARIAIQAAMERKEVVTIAPASKANSRKSPKKLNAD